MMEGKTEKGDPGQQELTVAWHALSAEEAIGRLQTDQEKGLSTEEANRRFGEYGPNELKEKPRP
jgi:Ca2+-transporting ATPase